MSLETLLARLKKVRKTGDGRWVACCPAHDDHDPSLSITYTLERILVHCHVGCRGEDVLGAVGLSFSDFKDTPAAAYVGVILPRSDGLQSAAYQSAADRARRIWSTCMPANASHPYLVRKRIEPHGVGSFWSERPSLIIPLQDIDEQLTSLQFIADDGRKTFLKSGRITGSFRPIGELGTKGAILLCEGFATGATLYEHSGLPVACAMSAGNLLSVAKALRSRYPHAELTVCADNDRFTAGNPGLSKATEAAIATCAKLCTPEFPEGAPGTDFNDLHLLELDGALRARICA